MISAEERFILSILCTKLFEYFGKKLFILFESIDTFIILFEDDFFIFVEKEFTSR